MIAGHYRLVEHIGSGAMGVVWRAVDVRLERSVAIKQILPQPGVSEAERDNMRQRAMREAKNAARFQHPNAIVVFDIAEHGGDPCLVMEFLDGPSLSAVLAEQGTLPVGQVARIGEQVAAALVAAHRSGIVHRDVKPGNILIDETGTAKITDFGISRAAGDMTLTQTGLIGGTPAYLAPELARGADPVPSSDVFALGATLYQAIEGQTPYGNTTNQLALLYAAANGQINPPTQAGPATALLMSLLRSEPGDRPSMAEAREGLAKLASGEPAGLELLSGPTTKLEHPNARPPWQRVDGPKPGAAAPIPAQKAPSNPPRTPTAAFMPMRSPAAPPNTPPRPQPAAQPPRPTQQQPRPAAPSAAAPNYRNAGGSTPPPGDNKKKFALLAGGAAAVVVIAVVVFLVLSNGTSGTGGSTTADQPQQTNSTGAPGKPSSNPSAAPPVAGLGETPNEGKLDYTPAGQRVIDFYSFPEGLASAWGMLTPAAQQVYGSQQAFAQYWSQYKSVSSKQARGSYNADGSVTISVTVVFPDHSEARNVRVVSSGGQILIDANTKSQQDATQ
ncbi:serine/threonine-protein kinase [Amycolatopsis rhabdoformis]|uniref:non-specific serine/threonine protein kinase n=1 Tax=Amycolatopsis rhabdoformis TaxID=1448059 RepID=A0ABZ1ILB9_9PSEU|nr:serine/threonine-protein kinase [Amycolatopsis rhabdoformis]WSE35077.1 serine/threonine-protein kinase [Amycolatopsis rhabdoformis]